MLQITIPGREQWDEKNQIFLYSKDQTLQLEHSLISISKWESKWCKSFLSSKDKTIEETLDYIRCMTITPNIDPNIYYNLTKENLDQVEEYISAPMTATYFAKDRGSKTNKEVVTSELIYYWMIANNIPVEFQKWHINRLLTLIRVCSIKNAPAKKMSKSEIARRNAALNAERRKRLGSSG